MCDCVCLCTRKTHWFYRLKFIATVIGLFFLRFYFILFIVAKSIVAFVRDCHRSQIDRLVSVMLSCFFLARIIYQLPKKETISNSTIYYAYYAVWLAEGDTITFSIWFDSDETALVNGLSSWSYIYDREIECYFYFFCTTKQRCSWQSFVCVA